MAFILCETWSYSYDETQFNVAGYNSFFTSNDSYRAGGVAIYVRDDIPACKLSLRVNSCDALLVELVMSEAKIQLTAVYRSPSAAVSDLRSFVREDVDVIIDAMDPAAQCLIVGDVNICLDDSSSLSCEYQSNLCSRGFLCLNDPSPTRVSAGSSSRIDHAYGRIRLLGDHVPTTVSTEGFLDHRSLNLSFPDAGVTPVVTPPKTVRSIDYVKAVEHFCGLDWSGYYSTNDPDSQASLLRDRCLESLAHGSTVRKLRTRYRPVREWMNAGLVMAIETRRRLYRLYRRRRTLEARLRYETYNNRLRSLLRSKKNEFYRNKVAGTEGDSAATWRFVNSYVRGKTSAGTIDPRQVNETLDGINHHFALLGRNTVLSAMRFPDPAVRLPPPSQRFFTDFTVPGVPEIVAVLESIGERKASGVDGIPGTLLKRLSASLAPHLCELIGNMITAGIYPSIFKTALLFPVHKSGSMSSISNFRPISLLPALNRVTEKILADQLYAAVEQRGILSPNQYGFRRGRSCEQAAERLVSYVTEATDRGSYCAALFFDISKAFDSISHERLLMKLERIGIGGGALRLLRSYLTERNQVYRFNGETSRPKFIPTGVPQGSNLGPLLFLLFINDLLLERREALAISFADDTLVLITHEDPDGLATLALESGSNICTSTDA